MAREPLQQDEIEWFDRPKMGTVVTPIAHQRPGRIQALASDWPARLYDARHRALHPNEVVLVVGRQGITLLVMPQEIEAVAH